MYKANRNWIVAGCAAAMLPLAAFAHEGGGHVHSPLEIKAAEARQAELLRQVVEAVKTDAETVVSWLRCRATSPLAPVSTCAATAESASAGR